MNTLARSTPALPLGNNIKGGEYYQGGEYQQRGAYYQTFPWRTLSFSSITNLLPLAPTLPGVYSGCWRLVTASHLMHGKIIAISAIPPKP